MTQEAIEKATEEEVKQMLDNLFTFESQLSSLNDIKAKKIAEAIPPEVQEAIQQVDKLVSPGIEKTSKMISDLKKKIKDAVLAHEETISGEYVQAVYYQGRRTWDSDILDVFLEEHTFLKKAQRIGDPYVSFSKVAKKKGKSK